MASEGAAGAAVASLAPGHVTHAWYSSTCLSKPSSWPLFICKVSVFLSALHCLCFLEDLENLGTLDAMNLVYSILQMRNLLKVPDLVRQSQATSCPPVMPLGGGTPALVGHAARRTGGLNLRILFIWSLSLSLGSRSQGGSAKTGLRLHTVSTSLSLAPVLRQESRFYICFKRLGTLKSRDAEASCAEVGPFYSCWKKMKVETSHASKDIQEVSN